MRELADPVEFPLVMLMRCIDFESRLGNIKRFIHLAWSKSHDSHNSPKIVAIKDQASLIFLGDLRGIVIVMKIS